MNYVLNICWKLVKKLIDEKTVQKFNFISGQDDIKNLVLTKIHPSQLEMKFGGEAENITDEVEFPFILPSDQYQIDDRNRSQIVTEEEYIELFNNNKLVIISPYLIQEGKIKLESCLRNSIYDKGRITYNRDGNPVYNGVEFFECQSQKSSEMDNNGLYKEMKDEKLLRGKNKFKNSNQQNDYINNTAFETGEKNANICKCSCLIY